MVRLSAGRESVDEPVEQQLEAGVLVFSQLESHPFTEAFKHSAPVVIGLFLAAALLSLALPPKALAEDEVVAEL